MKKIFLLAGGLFALIHVHSREENRDHTAALTFAPPILAGKHFILQYQVFESHDAEGTNIDTVHHNGDDIFFAPNGMAYLHYRNNLDSIGYVIINADSLSFGDTPFQIIKMHSGAFKLYQNEEMRDGSYNRVTYLLNSGVNH